MEIEYPFNIKDLKIVLYRKLLFNELPYYSLSIHGNGEVTYEGHFENVNIQKVNILPVEVFKLFRHAIDIDFFKVEDTGSISSWLTFDNDMVDKLSTMYELETSPYSKIEFTIGESSKTVHINVNAPKRFEVLANRIIKAAGAKKWINGEDVFFDVKNEMRKTFNEPFTD
ncbi:MAG: hypothetical protein JWR05_2289 [Mucilaginibacter sp.]|nr:hypothetical protein [Mucilaginibacter sp.]